MKIVVKDIKKLVVSGKKLLQFTFQLSVNDISGTEHGIEVQHCIAFIRNSEIAWNCPLNYFKGGNGRKQLHAIAPGTYNSVLNTIKRSKFISYLEDPIEELNTSDEVLENE